MTCVQIAHRALEDPDELQEMAERNGRLIADLINRANQQKEDIETMYDELEKLEDSLDGEPISSEQETQTASASR